MTYLVTDYLEESAKKFPDKTAFADVNTSITWSELLERSKKLSAVLGRHFDATKPVPIMIEKSVRTLEYFFAALYAGCFYSYIDATFPDSRLNSMMETLGAKKIVADRRFAKKLQGINITPIFFDDIEAEAQSAVYTDTRIRQTIDTDAVYANFTSGSTGAPKAVAVSHRSVIDFISCFTELFGITADDNIANQAPFDFDVSVKDIFSGIFTGATVHLVPKMFFSFPTKLLDYLEERQITTLIWAVSALCIVSTLNGFDYKVPSKIKRVMFSGEVMPVKQLQIWQKFYPTAEFINLYGPTEITCNCTYSRVSNPIADDGVIPMGVPFPNERVFLLDENDAPITNPDTAGEVCVSGTCVAIGYYNNDEKTRAVFCQNPLQGERYERIYRTGDLATFDKDGIFYYIGRKDTQIKHMGHRIELGEIEGAIMRHDNISRACCVFVNNKISAFYMGQETNKKELVTLLKQTLPAYMVPSDFIRIENFPITKNGKVDRRALEAKLNECE